MRAIVYTRVSAADRAEGPGGQEHACAAYARGLGLEVVGPFRDEGVSGVTPPGRRPGLMDAMGAIGRGDVLVVARRDRLGRDPIVVATIEAAVARAGGRVASAAGEGTGGDDPGDRLLRRIVDAFSEYERMLIRARTRAALKAKRRGGDRAGPTPYGFDLVDDGRRSRAGGLPVRLVPNPAEQAILEEIRRMDGAGTPPAGIARALNARGVPSKTGKTWSNMGVRRILARDPADAAS